LPTGRRLSETFASGSSLFDAKVGVRVYDTVVDDGQAFLLEPAR
jgi:hypothetical protein